MSKQIEAPMPGKIIEILVKVGDEIKEYQPVLILEAMKMENQVSSSFTGKVREIMINLNDNVDMGQVLVTLE